MRNTNGHEEPMNDDSRDGGDSRESRPDPDMQALTKGAQSERASGGPKSKKHKSKKAKRAEARRQLAASAAAKKSQAQASQTPVPPAVKSEKPDAAAKADATPAPVTRAAHVEPDEDDESIPPTSGDALDEHDERFFAEGEAASLRAAEVEVEARRVAGRGSTRPAYDSLHEALHELQPPPRTVSPERRRKLTNYVKAAVAVSAVLCVAAAVRVGFTNATASEPARVAAASVAAPPPPVSEPAPAAPTPLAAPIPPPPAAPAAPPAAQAPAAETPAPTASAAVLEPTVPTKSAKEEKADARRLLERGRAKDAAAAAQRSVDIDPTDGDAWLLLGAAHQELGHGADAHTAFVACVKQGKRGEIGECRAMLTWNGPR
jgi:hypothetical protein